MTDEPINFSDESFENLNGADQAPPAQADEFVPEQYDSQPIAEDEYSEADGADEAHDGEQPFDEFDMGNQDVQVPNQGGQMELPMGNQDVIIGVTMTVDVVLCIDCTGSMTPLLNAVKQSAMRFNDMLREELRKKADRREVKTLRIKVIAFRDYYFDWEAASENERPMLQSPFFTLPDQNEEYRAFVDKLKAAGGADEPESALEALHLAFRSDWNHDPEATKKRCAVVLFTDASAHPLDCAMRYENYDKRDPEFSQHYPTDMPQSLDELQNEYMDEDTIPPGSRRLFLFAPQNLEPWMTVKEWDNTLPEHVKPREGLNEFNMKGVVTLIAGSL